MGREGKCTAEVLDIFSEVSASIIEIWIGLFLCILFNVFFHIRLTYCNRPSRNRMTGRKPKNLKKMTTTSKHRSEKKSKA